MPLTAGTQLDGYEVLSLLGAGGMGEVYRARDSVLRREVAIKVLPSYISQDPDRLRRFEQEAQAAAALNHPNILAVYQFGAYQGAPYLVSELLEGGTLGELLQRGPIPVRKAINYGVQIAHGLAAAHDKGIVHRDLKPDNLFVTRDGRIKILDFGLAKLMQPKQKFDSSGPTLTHGTDPGLVMGTAGYMSPEQVRGTSVDHRADIFAFGAILYEMLSGKRAFQRPTAAETMTAILNEEPPGISQIVQTTPPALQRVVHRCLEKNPEQRFQSAADLAFALEALSESGSSAPIATGTPSEHPRSKVPVWSTVLVAVLVLAAAAYYVIARLSSTVPLRISAYTQLTHDGHAGLLRGTDGSRLYLIHDMYGVAQVATSGGEVASMPVALSNPILMDVSPDGSTFLIASYTGGTTISHALWTARILGGSLRYIATGADASWSPDGSSIVYSTREGNIYVIRSDGTNNQKLASVDGVARALRWSPDEKVIRFSKGGALWEISSDGSNLHRLFPDWKVGQCCGYWAPDGRFFYFVSNGQIWVRDERHGLFRRSPAQPIQLTSGPIAWHTPLPSKDGKTLFASGTTAHGELIRFDSHTGQFQPYLTGLSADNLSFSQDGRFMAYVSYPEGILWRANRDGSGRVQLSNPPMEPEMPRWSPDGTQILFLDSSSQGHEEAYIVSAQGGSPRRILPNESGPQTDPNWSPDGRKVIFSTSPDGGADPQSVVKILDLDSNTISTLPGSVGLFSPRWSPDGRSISAVRMNSTTLNIFDIKTQQWSTPYKGVVAYPAWSEDSQSMFFMDFQDNPGVFRIHIADGAVVRLIDLKDLHYTGNTGMWMGLDPTDAPLFLRDIGTDDVYALTLEQK